MKIVLILLLIHKTFALPLSEDKKIYFHRSEEKFGDIFKNFVNSQPSESIQGRFDDRTDDLNLDLSTFFNDTNIVKSDNDINSFQIDEVSGDNLLNGDLYQDDIALTEEQKDFLNNTKNMTVDNRIGLESPFHHWIKDRHGKAVVPYELSDVYNKKEKRIILESMDNIEQHTCIQFKPYTRQKDYIYIESGKDCTSHLGKIGGRQKVNLNQSGCISRGKILHVLFHVLGFDHMQNHEDRDNYVKIFWKNIKEDKIEQFLKVDSRKFGNFNTTYDHYSVTHFSPTAFSKNGKRTIITKNWIYRNIIGKLPRLSIGDVSRLNNMYECDKN